MPSITWTTSGTWSVPAGVTTVDAQCWAEGGKGAAGRAGSGSFSGGGGGGGEYAEEPSLGVTSSSNITYTIGTGGTGTNTTFPGASVTVTANNGNNATSTTSGSGGSGSANTIHYNGGGGGSGITGSFKGGGGGGGGAGSTQAGGAGQAGGAAGTVASGGNGGNNGGGNGGNGTSSSLGGSHGGQSAGGGGGGGSTHTGSTGGGGAAGQITVTYTAGQLGTATLTGVGTLTALGSVVNPNQPVAQPVAPGQTWLRRFGTAMKHQVRPGKQYQVLSPAATLAGVGTLTGFGGLPNPVVVNQWANSYGQTPVFGGITSSLQSCVVPLNSSFSVGTGSGTPTAGNWLFTIASWTQNPSIIQVHTGASDDVHSWWRQFPASQASGNVRTSIAYTPNVARPPGYVYVAPDGPVAAVNVLVVEIQGLGPWDTLVATSTAYTGSGTSVNLSAGGAAGTFWIAGVGGDNTAAGQVFTPAGWTALATQTQTDGTDNTCDNILTAAFIPSTNSAVSVSGTSASAEDLSGFLLGVAVSGTSPVPAAQNPNWPYFRFEMAFGAGFNTPVSEMTWTDLSSRLFDFDETTGIQYQLGQLQSTNLTVTLDNVDGLLTSDNSSSPYYPHMAAGTPMRLRAALGTIGGQIINRWYVIQRNVQEWGQAVDDMLRRYVPLTGTDVWASLSSTPPTFYRAEIYEDNPYAWWPMSDQLLEGGVLPTTLLNAAVGNTNVMNVAGTSVTAQDMYGFNGADITAQVISSGSQGGGFGIGGSSGAPVTPPAGSVASYTVGADQGWMYGDPVSQPSSFATSNPSEPSPGSAAWQQTGLLGAGGGGGWYLTTTDGGFPSLTGGVTVEGWFNAALFGNGGGYAYLTGTQVSPGPVVDTSLCGQPYSAITLCTAANMTLQLSLAGALNIIVNGTSTPVYAGDLRDGTWTCVQVLMTTTTWQVLVNGGLTANVSGTASSSASWNTLTLNNPGGNVSYSHWMVFPYLLPVWRLLSHYTAAITGFGLVPPPAAASISPVSSPPFNKSQTEPNGGWLFSNDAGYQTTPDGAYYAGNYGGGTPGGNPNQIASYTMSLVAVANAGSYSSGPSARAVTSGIGQSVEFDQTLGGSAINKLWPYALWLSWTGVAPQFTYYTSPAAGSETLAGTSVADGVSTAAGYGAGASPPAAATPLGDTAGQRIERLMRNGRVTSPLRSIDPSPPLVQAPGSNGGGLQAGASIQAIQQSDGGLLFIDNMGNLVYWMRSHLAAQYTSPVWQIGPTTGSGEIPYYREVKTLSDPQRVWNVVTVQPFSPSGAQLPLLTPTNATAVNASQAQYGAQPYQVISWLQDQTVMQAQANWLFANFGQPQVRAEQVRIDAAPYPAAWKLVMGINVGDVVTFEAWQVGGGGTQYTFRTTEVRRHIEFGGHTGNVSGSVELTLDFEPGSYY